MQNEWNSRQVAPSPTSCLAWGQATALPCQTPPPEWPLQPPHSESPKHCAHLSLTFLNGNQRDGPPLWAFRLGSPEPRFPRTDLGVILEKRSRPGGPIPNINQNSPPHLSMFYSGLSQLSCFDKRLTAHAQHKIKSASEREEPVAWWICQEGEMWVHRSPKGSVHSDAALAPHCAPPNTSQASPWAGPNAGGLGG